jgi:hypothetical protein
VLKVSWARANAALASSGTVFVGEDDGVGKVEFPEMSSSPTAPPPRLQPRPSAGTSASATRPPPSFPSGFPALWERMGERQNDPGAMLGAT